MAKLELMVEMTLNMYDGAYLLFLPATCQSDMLAYGNPSKEKKLLRCHCDIALHEINQLQEKLDSLEKERKYSWCPF